jgi:hypothetical protein
MGCLRHVPLMRELLGRIKNDCNCFFGTLERSEHWEDFGVNERILLKWILKN